MVKRLTTPLLFVIMLFVSGVLSVTNPIAVVGQINITATDDSGGSAEMRIDEALKALQSNNNTGATMHAQEAQKSL